MRLANTGRACHPAVRPNSLRHWVLDESVIGDATDVMGGLAATLFGTAPGPTVLDGPTGKARRFSDVNAILRAPLAAADQAVMLGDWTVACLLRISAAPAGTVTAFTYAGVLGDAPADPQNYLMALQLTPARNLQMFWENGAGANVTSLASTYVLPVGPWTLIHWVKSATTGPGPVGTCSLTLYVNGYPVEKFSGVQNASDGGAAVWRIGGEENAGAPFQRWQRDIAGAYAWAGALTAAQVAEDMRRVRRLPFFTRADLRVEVQNSTGVGVDLTNTAGVDFVDSVSVTDEVDQPCTTARVDLFREVGNVSLAVLNTTTKLNLTNPLSPVSYAPLLLEGRGIEVFTARVPLGCTATGKDWESTFKGFIDEVEEGGEKTSLQCRDLGALLIDTYIEQTIPYGSDTGLVAVETAMQSILNDNDNDPLNNSVPGLVARTGSYAPIALWTPFTPLWFSKLWSQRREGVLMALRNLAAQTAWECRYRFDPLTDAWRLKFYDPERDRLDADVLLGPDEFQEIGRFQRSILGIRNVVRVVYPSSEVALPSIPPLGVGYIARQGWNNLDGESRRMTAYVEVESTLSIAAFGRRLFMEFAEAGTTQIDTIGEAFDMAYGALRDLEESKLTFSGTVQFMPELELNDIVILDSNPVLHTAQQRLAVRSVTHSFGEQATSTVELRGRPSVGWKRWLRLETRTGNGRPGVTTPQDANADMQQGPLLQVMRNLLDRTQAFQGGKFLQIRNPNFQGFTNGRANVPDGWSMRAGVWNTDATADTTDQQSGNIALKLLTSTAQLESDFIPVNGSRFTPYSFEAKWLRTSMNSGSNNASISASVINSVVNLATISGAAGSTCTLTNPAAIFNVPNSLGALLEITGSGLATANVGTWQVTGVTSTTVVTLTRTDGGSFVNSAGNVSGQVYSVATFTAPAAIFTAESVGGFIVKSTGANAGTWQISYFVSTTQVKLHKDTGTDFVNNVNNFDWVAPVTPCIDVEFYDTNKALIAGKTYPMGLHPRDLPSLGPTGLDNQINVWFAGRGDGVAPPDAGTTRWIKMVLRPRGAFAPLLIDDLSAYKTGLDWRSFSVSLSVPFAAPAVGWWPAQFSVSSYPAPGAGVVKRWDWGAGGFRTLTSGVSSFGQSIVGDVTLPNWAGWGFYAREDGTYLVTAIVSVASTSNAANQVSQVRFVLNATYANAGATVGQNAAGTVVAQSPPQGLQPIALLGNAQFVAPNVRGVVMQLTSRVRMFKGDRLTVEWYLQNVNQSFKLDTSGQGQISLITAKQELTE